ncbi:MAG: OmpH family outer membrane protein [Bacteroidales bacterium]|nr:OmpH family outer membrane protein [Bacteroidales bacterium]
MRKLLSTFIIAFAFATAALAQKTVFVDTEYILKNIPAYEAANDQLNTISKKYEDEVKAKYQEVEKLYDTYRNESVFLTNDIKVQRENEIVQKEQEAKKLQQEYFGQDGELFKQREILIKPIQEQIFNAISQLAQEKSYSAVWDKASSAGLMFSDKSLDISDAVLAKLGYGGK